MENSLPNNMRINDNVLYIIGNGFDLAHDMKTSYEDFHQWLLDNGESSAVNRIESRIVAGTGDWVKQIDCLSK